MEYALFPLEARGDDIIDHEGKVVCHVVLENQASFYAMLLNVAIAFTDFFNGDPEVLLRYIIKALRSKDIVDDGSELKN